MVFSVIMFEIASGFCCSVDDAIAAWKNGETVRRSTGAHRITYTIVLCKMSNIASLFASLGDRVKFARVLQVESEDPAHAAHSAMWESA